MTTLESRIFPVPEEKAEKEEVVTVTLSRTQVDSLQRALMSHRGGILEKYNNRMPLTDSDRVDLTAFHQFQKILPKKKKN